MPRTRAPGRRGITSTRSAYGGSCYLNNAAIAAQGLRARGLRARCDRRPGRAPRERRADDLLGSRRRPHRLGARRSGSGLVPALPRARAARPVESGEGAGANLNLPLAPGTGDEGWLAAVEAATAFAARGRRARRRARRRRRGRRSEQPVERDGGGLSRCRVRCSARSNCQLSSFRKVGTISHRSAGSWSPRSRGSKKGSGRP